MRFERSVAHLLIGLMVAFGVIISTALYWGVLGSDDALRSAFNYRQRDALAALERGLIVGRQDVNLVESVRGDGTGWRRVTLDPALPSLTGYASLTYGTGGAEAAYNAILTGTHHPETIWGLFEREVLHRPQRGYDVQLTVDLTIQRAAAEILDGRVGAVIVMDAKTGALLAVASSPTIDPTRLDVDWEALVKRPDNPFFNRALQSEYQTGGALQPVLVAGWLIAGHALDAELDLTYPADAAVRVGEARLTCLSSPSGETLTPAESLLTGCPAGFDALVKTIGETAITEVLTLFGATQHIELDGFTLPVPTQTPDLSTSDWRADALGQGRIRLSPLDMAVLIAALVNEGNAPSPYLLQATRPTPSDDWVLVESISQTRPVTTAQTAQMIQNLMRQSAQRRQVTEPSLGMHIAKAVSGDNTLTWFSGFIQVEPQHQLVAVMVIEDDVEASIMAEDGNRLLLTALNVFQPDTP